MFGDPFVEDPQPRNRLKSAIGSIAITSQHKILFPVVPYTKVFARETNSPFTSWSHDPFFEGQQPQNGAKSAVGSIANTDQRKILLPIIHNKIGFARKTNSSFIPWLRDTFFEDQ